jgi:hypothetical protein
VLERSRREDRSGSVVCPSTSSVLFRSNHDLERSTDLSLCYPQLLEPLLERTLPLRERDHLLQT